MAEKVRAVLGQRIFAVSRDLYDIYSLLDMVDEERVLEGLPKKIDVRGLDLVVERHLERRVERQRGRDRRLFHDPVRLPEGFQGHLRHEVRVDPAAVRGFPQHPGPFPARAKRPR